MYPLFFFESNQLSIGEVDSPSEIGAAILLLIALLIHALLVGRLRGFRLPSVMRAMPWGWALAIGMWLAALWMRSDMTANFLAIYMCLGAVIQICVMVWRRLREGIALRKSETPAVATSADIAAPIAAAQSQRRETQLAWWLLLAISDFCVIAATSAYMASYAYWLPASYPPGMRDQLRMMRRLIEAEPHMGDNEKPTRLLSEIHLVSRKDGSELIPDSLRDRGEYQGYRYTLIRDAATSGGVIIDAVPAPYEDGKPSIHGFVSYTAGWAPTAFTYCMTIAEHQGAPATLDDPHFHRLNLFEWRGGSLRTAN